MDLGNTFPGSLHWDIKGFKQLLDAQLLVDCTLCCDGGKISAHKIVLSACSSYLAKILAEHPVEHPIIILPELDIEDVKTLVYYMYTGELLKSNTLHSTSLLRTAAILSVNSLQDLLNGSTNNQTGPDATTTTTTTTSPGSPSSNRSISQQFYFNSPTTNHLHLHPNLQHQNHQQQQPQPQQQPQSQQQQYTTSSLLQQNSSNNTSLTSSSSTSPISLLGSQHQNHNPAFKQQSGSNNETSNTGATSNSIIVSGALNTKHQDHNSQSNNQATSHCGAGGPLSGSTGGIGSVARAGGQHQGKSDFQFKCPVCQNDFQTICSFEYHMQRIHNVTSFGCEICHRPFASLRYVLTDHMRRCHPDSIM